MWPTSWLKTHCLQRASEHFQSGDFILVSSKRYLTCAHQNHSATWTKMLEQRQTGQSLQNCRMVSSHSVNVDITSHSLLSLPRVRENKLRFSHWCPGLVAEMWHCRLVQYLQDPWSSFHARFLFWGILVDGCFLASDLPQYKSCYLDLGTWKNLWVSNMDMTCRLPPLNLLSCTAAGCLLLCPKTPRLIANLPP